MDGQHLVQPVVDRRNMDRSSLDQLQLV